MGKIFIYSVIAMLGLEICVDKALAQDTSSEREKAHIVSRVYEITYGFDEICQRIAPEQSGQVSELVKRFKKTYPELMLLVEQSPHLDKAKKLTQATLGMVVKAASNDPKSAGCQEALWMLKQYVEVEGAEQAVAEMISKLKK